MPKLTIGGSADYSGQLLFLIDTLDFTRAAEATFAGSQFGGARISGSVRIDGSSGRNTVVVNTDFRGLDAGGWSFANWSSEDRVVISGSDFREIISGSGSRDIISGASGNDEISGGGGNDTISGGIGMDELDGGGGIDTLSYEGSIGAVRVDLPDNTVSGGDATGDGIVNFENVTGGNGNDELRGDGASNRLQGGPGADLLSGGGGLDRFAFTAIGQSAAGSGRDRISDFSQAQNDRILLTAIDAVAGGRNDAFSFIGNDAFSDAGDLRYFFSGGQTIIQADVNGDRIADFEIVLDRTIFLAAGDFNL